MASDTKVLSDVSDRYKTVLDALIQQNYHVINDVYLDMFISHISGKNTQGKWMLEILCCFFCWSSNVSNIWKEMKNIHHDDLTIFGVKEFQMFFSFSSKFRLFHVVNWWFYIYMDRKIVVKNFWWAHEKYKWPGFYVSTCCITHQESGSFSQIARKECL